MIFHLRNSINYKNINLYIYSSISYFLHPKGKTANPKNLS